VLASNTSSMPIAAIARATDRPDRVIGLHFFNPPPMLDLIGLTSTLSTDPRVADAVQSWFGEIIGRTVIRSTDRSGFVVNALLVPYFDTGMRRSCGHPMGPLQLLDLIGLDTMVFVAEGLYCIPA
jgi:3-hydroxybutyryl-CoA dehydrogenase